MSAREDLTARLGSERGGYPLLAEHSGSHLLLVVSTPPRATLRLCEESALSQDLEKLGLADEEKCGDPLLDERYVVRGNSELLTAEVKEAIRGLEPFVELELTAREYRLLKEFPAEDLAAAEQAADGLVRLVALTSSSR